MPKLFHKINSTVLFGRNLKERPVDLDNFKILSAYVRVVDLATDRGQIIYVDEMFIIKIEIRGGSPSVILFISSAVQIPDLDR